MRKIALRFFDLFFLLKDTIFFMRSKLQSARVFLCIANPGTLGGTELQVQIIARHLQEKGVLVVLLGRVEEGRKNRFLRDLRREKIPVLRIGRIILPPWFFRLLSKEAQICHFFNPLSTVLAFSAKKAGLRIVYTETGLPDGGKGWEMLKKAVSFFDHVTSVSKAGLTQLQHFYGFKGPFSVIPSLIHPFPYAPRSKKEDFHLIYFGRLTLLKAVHRLIFSFSQALKKIPNSRLSIVGTGEMFFDLQAQAKQLGIEEKVLFTGHIEREALHRYLQEADLFCLPSETEGLPSSILEAMAIGLPILATDVGGISELLEHEKSGIIIPPKDQEALTNQLLRLAEDFALRDRLAKHAFFSWQKRKGHSEAMETLFAIYNF